MGAVGDFLDPSEPVPMTIGGVNATQVTLGHPSIPIYFLGAEYTPMTAVNVPGGGAQTAFETVVAANPLPLSPVAAFHVITGNTGFASMTGGVEGQIATCIFTGTPLITTAADLTTANHIHLNSYATATAPANFQCAATAGVSCVKTFLFSAVLISGQTAGQWFELPS
jgi:hypothetical protein